jgi:hypothetical protein
MRKSPEESRYRFLFWRTEFVGFAMIVSGLLFVFINFKMIPVSDFVLPRVLGILFIMGGLIFLFFTGAGGWLSWFVIPAGILLTGGVDTLILGTTRFISMASGSLLSIGLGLTFLAVFLTRKNHWWALIPSGTCVGLAGWLALGIFIPPLRPHPIALVFALGLSFLVIYLYSVQKGRMRWSLFVGTGIVFVSFCYLLAFLLARWRMLWPIVLLLVGLLVPVGILFLERRPRERA